MLGFVVLGKQCKDRVLSADKMESSPATRNLPRNEEVFRSLLQATVRNMFDDDEDHKDDSVCGLCSYSFLYE